MGSKLTEGNIGIPREKFLAIIIEVRALHPSLTSDAQSGFQKLVSQSGAKMYVALTKNTFRVDLSGWPSLDGNEEVGPKFGVVKFPAGEGNGKVHHMLDMRADSGMSEADILLNFKTMLELMASLPAVEKKAPAPKKEAKQADPGREKAKGQAQPNGGIDALEAELDQALARAKENEPKPDPDQAEHERRMKRIDEIDQEFDAKAAEIRAKIEAEPDLENEASVENAAEVVNS